MSAGGPDKHRPSLPAPSGAARHHSAVAAPHGSFWMLLPTAYPDVRKRMRDWVATQLRSWPAHRVLDVTIVIDELATNAFLHGDPPFIARLILSDDGHTLVLEVHNGGPRGRWPWDIGPGLRLVASITPDWGVSRRRFGTVVWARLPLDQCRSEHVS